MNRPITSKMSELLNTLGNEEAKAGWPNKELFNGLMDCHSEVMNMEMDLYDCVNYLCFKCGDYQREHEGACKGCRWLDVKEGFRD